MIMIKYDDYDDTEDDNDDYDDDNDNGNENEDDDDDYNDRMGIGKDGRRIEEATSLHGANLPPTCVCLIDIA